MVEVKNIDGIIKKIETLHNSLKLSDEILPMVSDMFVFIKGIIPLMVEINTFTKESTHKIPTASHNIHKVSRVTETATNEVLDKLESITSKIDQLKSSMQRHKSPAEDMEQLNDIQNEASDIVLAFQFQDITSQHLEQVNRILQAIYEKFEDLFHSSLKLKGETLLGNDLIEAIQSQLGGEDSRKASSRFEQRTADMVRQSGIPQERIDQYFKQ